MNKWNFKLEEKQINEKFGLFSTPTTSTRHGRVHGNVFMVWGAVHEAHEDA